MSNELSKAPRKLDSFEGYTNETEGEEGQQSTRSTAPIVKFTNEATWVCHGEKLPLELELIVVDIGRETVKWGDGELLEVRPLAPAERFPDTKRMNAETPQSEWREGPSGDLQGPWQNQHVVYLLNPVTMDAYRYPSSTTGGSIAINEIVQKTKWRRRYTGKNEYPVVKLGDVFMPTRFGGRQRPCFIVLRWVLLDGDGAALASPDPTPALPPASVKAALDLFAETPSEKTTAGERAAELPSHAEEMKDSIPF